MNRFSEDNDNIALAVPPSTNQGNGKTPHPHPSPPSGEGSIGDATLGGDDAPSSNGSNGEATSERETAGGTGSDRSPDGRFARGNRGGPGNPFARKTAALRKALVNSATEEDIQAVAQRIIAQAKEGDMAAAKLLLAYVIGKPAEAVDPDTLDVQEWQTQREQAITPKDLSLLLGGVPAETVVPVMREVVPCLGRNFANTMLRQMADRGWPEAQRYVAPRAANPESQPARAPSTNRPNGRRSKKRRHQKTGAPKDPPRGD